jgi:thiopurine S-methyltransferase
MDSNYWSSRYQNKKTRWDLGKASPPLIEIFRHIDKNAKILIPGCGNAYEAESLFNSGYPNVYIIDLAKEPLEEFKKRNKSFPTRQIILGDFFTHFGEYDFIIEQTFFCAIQPILRKKYVHKVHQLLKPGGMLWGVLFNRAFEGGPPFGGSQEEYKILFNEVFGEVEIKECLHSVQPRLGAEVMIKCIK